MNGIRLEIDFFVSTSVFSTFGYSGHPVAAVFNHFPEVLTYLTPED